MSLIADLSCFYCSKIYKKPVSLPCGDSLCEEHLHETKLIQKNKIKCLSCQKEFDLKGNQFPANKPLQKLIEREIFLSEEERNLKNSLKESFNTFLDDYLQVKYQLNNNTHVEFRELQRKIDIGKEELKSNIDKMASILSSQIETKSDSIENSDRNKTKDSNFSTKSLQDALPLKQEDTLAEIKARLDELERKESSAAINELLSSKILKGNQCSDLIRVCQFYPRDNWTLVYRGSDDGFDARDFHDLCDGVKNTLTIIKAKETSYIFGGYTEKAWDSFSLKKSDPNAFIYSLTNAHNQPIKIPVDPCNVQDAIYCDSEQGPTFGLDDICIENSKMYGSNNVSIWRKKNHSNLNHIYKHPNFRRDCYEAKSFLAGSFVFDISEIEVYTRK
jgi:hypothetical protein